MFQRRIVAALVVGGVVAAAARQPAALQAPAQPLTSGAAAIVVDAVVRDGKGKPVTDLRKEDFQLLEDGVVQTIGDVTEYVGGSPRLGVPGGTAATAAGGGPAPAAPSFTAIVFSRLAPEPRARAYQGALACLDTLRDGDYVGIFTTDLSLSTIQPYTRDRAQVRKGLEAAVRRASWTSPIALFPEEPSALAATTATSGTWDRLGGLQQGHAATDALLAIVTGIAVVPGRKSVMFFSEGIPVPNEVLPQFRGVIATANRGSVTVYTIDAAGLRTASEERAAGDQVRAAGAAALTLTADGSNSSSLGAMEGVEGVRRTPHAILTMLAAETGGFLIENTNDLKKGFRQADSDRRFYYLLSYTPKNTAFNGERRSITLKVPKRRVTVRARSGYLAPRSK
jgi:VWFA-related protein